MTNTPLENRVSALEHPNSISVETRLAILENDQRILDAELRDVKETVKGVSAVQSTQHAENGLRLTGIECTLLEIKVYFKVGRWVMNAIWAIGGAVAATLFAKWVGSPPKL